MARKAHQDPRQQELIPVIYARNLTEAEFYRSLLEEQDLPVVIQKNNHSAHTSPSTEPIPVLVPENSLTEAQYIIDHRDQADDDLETEFEEFYVSPDKICDYDELDQDIINPDRPERMDQKDLL